MATMGMGLSATAAAAGRRSPMAWLSTAAVSQARRPATVKGRYRAAMPDEPGELAPVDRATFVDRYGPRALVAGGAAGMGAEYCRQIAALGIDLVVLDRDEAGLAAIAGELRSS